MFLRCFRIGWRLCRFLSRRRCLRVGRAVVVAVAADDVGIEIVRVCFVWRYGLE